MPSSAKKVLSKKIVDNTNCAPSDSTPKSRTDLNLDLPPTRIGEPRTGKRVRPDQAPYVANQMTKSSTAKKVAVGAAVLGGLAAGAYALYKSTGSQSSDKSSRGTGNTLASLLPNGEAVTIRKRQEVDAKSSVVYAEWRKLENLPNILTHLKEVKVLDEKRSLWTAKGPAGTSVNWYANITEDEPGRAISWKSEEKADVPNSGRILFSETPQGKTLIEVTLTYQPPAGAIGQAVAAAFGENPEKQVKDDLKNFKKMVEKTFTA